MFVSFHSLHGAESFQDRERKLEQEIDDEVERSASTLSEQQRKWDELRKGFDEAYVALLTDKPEQTVIAKLKTLFDRGGTIETYNGDFLESAVLRNAKLVTKYILEKGADPDGFRSDKKPLKIATQFGDHEIITLLRQYGAKPLDPAEAAQLRLKIAAGRGDLKNIKLELSKGADIDSRDTLDNTTALIQAVIFNRLQSVKMLLTMKADPKSSGHIVAIDYLFAKSPYRSGDGSLPIGMCTPLHAATLPGRFPEIIRLLLKAGARVSSTNCYKNLTPLHVAARVESAPAVTALLKEGAKVTAKDSDGKTPLDYAESGPVIKLLKDYGAREAP
jgi:ankyrin repeat protein